MQHSRKWVGGWDKVTISFGFRTARLGSGDNSKVCAEQLLLRVSSCLSQGPFVAVALNRRPPSQNHQKPAGCTFLVHGSSYPEPPEEDPGRGCAPERRMLCGSPIRCSLLAFVIYTLVFQGPQGHSGPLHVTAPPDPITVAKGENVVLPCGFSPGQDALDTEVIWFREQFSPFVHRYKWGQDQYGEQMLQYQGRTELRKDGLAKGSADLKLFHVRPSDTGNYTCFVRRGSDYDDTWVELKVTDPLFEDAPPWRIVLAVVLVAVVALLIIIVYLFRIKGKQQKEIERQQKALRDSNEKIEEQAKELERQQEALWDRDAEIEEQAKELERQQEALRDSNEIIGKQAQELAWRRHAVPIEEGNLVLDPDTAHCELVVSDNGKSVTRGDPREDIPYTPNRFDVWRCVLGRDGFTSGRHYWEVEVEEDTGTWAVGVSREDGKRKGCFRFEPEKGVWAVGKQGQCLKAFTSTHPTSFPEIQAPRRIRVSLDYEGGRVSFFSVDEGIHIFTFPQASFGGIKAYPWVWVGPETCLKIWP